MQLESVENKGLIEFCDTYRQVDWNALISNANQSIVICVYFWDKWVQQHEQALCDFLKKPNTSLQFFFSSALPEIQRLFPNNTIEQLKDKIRNTYMPLQSFLNAHHLPANKVTIHHVPHPLNYSMQCLDGKTLLMSFFEMFRSDQVDSPSIRIDLDQAPNSKKFYQKELQGLIELSKNNKA